ncbi:MAG TPA: hypothetical protein VGF55_28460 [Gemmataceae bacterium]
MPPLSRRLAVAILLALAAAAPAQPPAVAARGVEADVRLGLRDAQRLADTDRPKALDRLQKLLATLEADRLLPPDRRDALTRVIRDRIRVVEAAPAPTPEPKLPPLPPEAVKRAEEFARLKAGLREAVALRKEGKTAEANVKATELARLYPDSPAAQVLTDIGQTTASRDESRSVRKDKEQGNLAGLNGVDRSGVMPKSDVEFAKDHRERTAKRKADTAPTAAELKLLQALDTPVKAEFQNSRLEDVMDYLSTMMNLTVVLDKAALDELNLTYNSPVTFVVKKPVAARSALRGVLRSLGLTYVVRDGTVFVTTPTKAREYMVTKSYYLGDLVSPIGNPFFPVGDPLQEAFNVQSLIDLIVTTIDPDSWDLRGGPGTIRYYPPTKSLIVRQSAEVHVSLKASLSK